MRYPLQQYERHSDGWGKARLLTRVRPKPEESDQWIDIGPEESYAAVQFRIMHMLSEQGCTPEEREYYGLRFFAVNRFIGLNMARLTKEWMVIVSDGGKAVATDACVKAVLEAFEPEPMPDIEDVSLDKIIAWGRQLLKTGVTD
jgi:hypothetical protein